MKRLLIAGAGGLGREVFEYAKMLNSIRLEWDIIAFLDDNPRALDSYGMSALLAGSIKEYQPDIDDQLICAIGDAVIRSSICRELEKRGGRFVNIIHTDAYISKSSKIGKGVVIFPGAYVFSNTIIEDFVVINSLTTIGHDATVKMGCVISAQCDIMGFACLEEEAFLGSGARIFPGVFIGKRARVGAGSVVIRNVKANTSVFGNPAKAIYNPKSE